MFSYFSYIVPYCRCTFIIIFCTYCMSLGVEEIWNRSGGAVLSLNSSLLWVVTLRDWPNDRSWSMYRSVLVQVSVSICVRWGLRPGFDPSVCIWSTSWPFLLWVGPKFQGYWNAFRWHSIRESPKGNAISSGKTWFGNLSQFPADFQKTGNLGKLWK